MTQSHRTDEKVLREIIHRNVKCNDEDKLRLIIYYKSKRSKQLIMKNNSTRKEVDLPQTNILHEYSCPQDDCRLLQTVKYIGMTLTAFSRRITMYIQSGVIEIHMREAHITLTR